MVRVRRVSADVGRWWGMSRRLYVVDLLARSAQEFSRRRGSTYAAAMSYYVLFSFFPLLIFIVAVFGVVVRDEEAQVDVTRTILETLPAGVDLQENVQNVIAEVARTGHGLVGAGALIGTLWTASGMFTALRRALNAAFGGPESRSFVRGKALDLAGVLGVLVLLPLTLLAIVLIAFVVALGIVLSQAVLPAGFIEALPLNFVGKAFFFLISFAISFVMMLLLYRIVPDRRLRWSDLRLGAALAALGFELAKLGFGLYLANFGRYQEVYGALGSGVAFLFFVFVVSNIVIFVAVLISERLADRGHSAGSASAS